MVLASLAGNQLGILEKIKAWREENIQPVLASHSPSLSLSYEAVSPHCVALHFFVGSDVSFPPLQLTLATCEDIVCIVHACQ